MTTSRRKLLALLGSLPFVRCAPAAEPTPTPAERHWKPEDGEWVGVRGSCRWEGYAQVVHMLDPRGIYRIILNGEIEHRWICALEPVDEDSPEWREHVAVLQETKRV